jgi:general secretion pathway protein A
MYAESYGLAKKPFNMTPDPAFLFHTKQHREALAGLVYAILDRKGFLVLSGVAGCGKTTLLAWVLGKLPRERVQSSVILNPTLTREEFLEMAMLDFGITEIPDSKARRLWILQHFLLKGHREGKINVLIVDEAHKLTVELLEEIRLLGNLENGDDKLIQILLIGQRELDDVMSRPELWQLKQRVSVRLALEALSAGEVEKYIEHRWTVAGGKLPLPFTAEALVAVGKRSTGIPRVINSLCDSALTLAFADNVSSASVDHVEAAAQDLRLIPKPSAPLVVAAAAGANGTAKIAAATSEKTMVAAVSVAPEPEPEPLPVLPPSAPKVSVLGRWAHKFGLGSNGQNRI